MDICRFRLLSRHPLFFWAQRFDFSWRKDTPLFSLQMSGGQSAYSVPWHTDCLSDGHVSPYLPMRLRFQAAGNFRKRKRFFWCVVGGWAEVTKIIGCNSEVATCSGKPSEHEE